jgi:streptogramin lyase
VPTVRFRFRGPGPQANGLQAAPEGLWICDQVDNRVYLVDYADGATLTWFDTPARNMSGIAAGGGAVWAASNRRPSTIYRFNPANGHCLAALLLPRPDEGGVHGVEWADGSLWVTRPGFLSIQQIDPETGGLLHEIPFPAQRSHGLYWDDGTLVCVETNHHVVYRLDPRTGEVRDQWVIEGFEPHGMTRDREGRVWLCDASTNRIGVLE